MITDNYVRQCEQAEEIQEAWKPQLGDWFYSKEVDDTVTILGFTKESRRVIDKGIYTPTLEQLWEEVEELLFGEKCELNIIVHDGKEYIIEAWQVLKGMSCVDEAEDTYTNTYKVKGKNIKECLLKLIMEINWNKIWTGEKWEDK